MSPADWAAIAVAVTTIIAAFVGSIRWLVSHYLNELKPNGGSSVKDQLNRLEKEFEIIKDLVIELVRK